MVPFAGSSGFAARALHEKSARKDALEYTGCGANRAAEPDSMAPGARSEDAVSGRKTRGFRAACNRHRRRGQVTVDSVP
jgi:hypothetical protein